MKRLSSLLCLLAVGAGCGSAPTRPAEGPVTETTSPIPPQAAPASALPASGGAATGLRKRKRTAAAKPSAPDGTKPKNAHPVNPKDPVGRTVFAQADDQCFIEVPPKNQPAADAPPSRATEIVDCPAEMDDPAWDHCTAQIVVDAAGKCYCVTGAGNPRPMPNPTACPASSK